MRTWLYPLFLALAVFGCDDGDDGGDGAGGMGGGAGGEGGGGMIQPDAEGCHHRVAPGPDVQAALQTVFIEVEPGQTICLEAGDYSFDTELSMSVDGVTIRGAGADQTRLDFSNQTVGANGIAITGDGVLIEKLAVYDPPGDGVRAQGVDGIIFRDLHVEWTTPAESSNGAYGLYPVEAQNVLIDGCVVVGASDAGIYVGQSTTILVRDSEAYGNVAGIEIENSFDAEVVNNHAHDNTGGLLVFSLPELPMKGGGRVLVHGNLVENNNLPNFGRAGSIVSMVPGGTGAFILSTDDNEFRENTFRNNDSAGMMIISFIEAFLGSYDDDQFDPYPERNWVHDNVYEGNGNAPQGIFIDLGFETGYDFFTDGCLPEMIADADRNCLGEIEGTTFRNLDFCARMRGATLADHTCEGAAVPGQAANFE